MVGPYILPNRCTIYHVSRRTKKDAITIALSNTSCQGSRVLQTAAKATVTTEIVVEPPVGIELVLREGWGWEGRGIVCQRGGLPRVGPVKCTRFILGAERGRYIPFSVSSAVGMLFSPSTLLYVKHNSSLTLSRWPIVTLLIRLISRTWLVWSIIDRAGP